MPAGNPPHKRNRAGRATDEQRVAMVERAISGNPHFELSLIEMHDHGLSYTYHTLGESPESRTLIPITTLSSVQIPFTVSPPG